MALDLRQLECFIAVAEEGNIGRAALRLHMTQPPLTRRIQRLERDVGADLFIRTSRGIEITSPGLALLEQARRIVALSARAVEITQASQAGESGQLVVGYFGSTIFGAVPRLLADFSAAHPGVEIRLERQPKSDQIEALRDGTIHIAFSRLYGDEPGLVVRDLATEPLYVALAARHQWYGCRQLRVADLAGQPLVLFPRARPSFADEVVKLCTAAGFKPRVHSEAEDAVTALAQVAIGSGVAVVPESACNIALPGLGFTSLADAPEQSLSCIHRQADTTPVLVALLSFIDRWRPG
jgi:DNA-binding transcriptional LysR family regulator